jgi:hypothetical protein
VDTQHAHRHYNAALAGMVVLVGAASIGAGVLLASLGSGQAVNSVLIQAISSKVKEMESTVETVDVYDLRIATLEDRIGSNQAAVRILEIIINDLKGDIRVLEERSRPPAPVPLAPADDNRDQYYTTLGKEKE